MLESEDIEQSHHWADLWAAKIVATRGDKDIYTCASGITPSGTVHIGNFREIISVELVVRALRQKGKKVRFLYSWDDYDVFRKVPHDIPNPDLLKKYLRYPLDYVPDTSGQYENYAQANEKAVEKTLPLMGIFPEYIYQAERYRSATYAKGMRLALECCELIVQQLNMERHTPLPANWFPILIFCEHCHRDTTIEKVWDGDWSISYFCEQCHNKSSIDLRYTGVAKLPWRIDWPMRWAFENVDFEPAGKDHHSDGGSFSTAAKTVLDVYKHPAPLSFQYDFVRAKGGSGKISSSLGNVITLEDCLSVYQPEVIRFLFVSTRPNREFAISFDLDVLKIYEDYDRLEILYYNPPVDSMLNKDRKKWIISARIYELSQIDQPSLEKPYQIGIRHLCTLLQIYEGDIVLTLAQLTDINAQQKEYLQTRCRCAWTWICHYAPEDFRFSLLKNNAGNFVFCTTGQNIIEEVYKLLPLINTLDQNEFSTHLYSISTNLNIENSFLFSTIYRAILGKEKGPRLVNFLYTIGAERLTSILKTYLKL